MKIMVMTPDKALHLLSFVVVLEMDQVGEKQCHDELFLIKRLNVLVGKEKEVKGTLKICLFQG